MRPVLQCCKRSISSRVACHQTRVLYQTRGARSIISGILCLPQPHRHSNFCTTCHSQSAPPSSAGCTRARTALNSSKRSSIAIQQEEHVIVQSLILSWFAASNRSQFAAQCFVESVVVAYRYGLTIDELKVNIALYCTQLQLQPQWSQQEAILTSWMAIVMLTLYSAGLDETFPSASQTKKQKTSLSKDGLGVMKYVKQNLQMYEEGNTLAQVQDLQYAANQMSNPSPTGFTLLMQQYTLLVFITLEVLSLSNLHTSVVLSPPSSLSRLTPFTPLNPVTSSKATPALESRIRATSVQLLIAFMGAVLGQPFSMKCFVELVLSAYQQGWRAADVIAQVEQEEFEQTGGFTPVGLPLYQGAAITKQLFGRWLSIVYMVFAQMGVYHPGAQFQVGWAWAGEGNEVEANRLADFVSGAIIRAARESGDPELAEEAELAANRLTAQLQAIPELAPQLEKAQREALQVLDDGVVLVRNKAVAPMTSVEDSQLASTSPVIRMMAQHVDLVSTAWRLVHACRTPEMAAAQSE